MKSSEDPSPSCTAQVLINGQQANVPVIEIPKGKSLILLGDDNFIWILYEKNQGIEKTSLEVNHRKYKKQAEFARNEIQARGLPQAAGEVELDGETADYRKYFASPNAPTKIMRATATWNAEEEHILEFNPGLYVFKPIEFSGEASSAPSLTGASKPQDEMAG